MLLRNGQSWVKMSVLFSLGANGARFFTVWAKNVLLMASICSVYAALYFYLCVFLSDILLFVPFCFYYIFELSFILTFSFIIYCSICKF